MWELFFLVSNKTLNLFFLIWLMYNYYEYMGRNPPKTMDRHFAIVNKHLITKVNIQDHRINFQRKSLCAKKIKQSYSKNKLEENREFLFQNIKQKL